MDLKNSTFTDGKGNHVRARKSGVSFDNVTMFESTDITAKGHGFYCKECTAISIKDSTFRNLTSLIAPAILIENNVGTATIENSTFLGNHAYETSGSIRLFEP